MNDLQTRNNVYDIGFSINFFTKTKFFIISNSFYLYQHKHIFSFLFILSASQVHLQYFLLKKVYILMFLMCSTVIYFLEFSLLVLDSVWKSFSFSFPVGESFHFLILFEQKYLTFMDLLSKVFLITRDSSLPVSFFASNSFNLEELKRINLILRLQRCRFCLKFLQSS